MTVEYVRRKEDAKFEWAFAELGQGAQDVLSFAVRTR